MTTAPAAAPAPGPVAPPPARAASQPSANRFAFAAMLDSLPSGPAKASAPNTEHQSRAPNESQREKSPGEETAHHSPLNDGGLLASLPFALRVVSMMGERPQAPQNSPSLASAATKAAGPEPSGTSIAANAMGISVGRLIGERAFHFGASTPGGLASRSLAMDAAFASAADLSPQARLNGEGAPALGASQAEATLPQPFADVVQSTAPARIPARAGSPVTNRVSPARAAAHEASRSGSRLEAPAPLPAVKAESSGPGTPPAGSGGDGKAHDGREPDPIASMAQPTAQTGPFGGLQSAGFVADSLFELGASTAGAAAQVTPRGSASAANPISVAQPVREIDVDLSPGGLEDVSMTMRLAGEKLSVVVRAGSSHTLNSIEGARDAIADRLAAIGQSLDSLIVKQTGLNTDGNTNANTSSAEDGGTGSNGRSAQSAGERGGSNDALSRRGAGRDRSF